MTGAAATLLFCGSPLSSIPIVLHTLFEFVVNESLHTFMQRWCWGEAAVPVRGGLYGPVVVLGWMYQLSGHNQ